MFASENAALYAALNCPFVLSNPPVPPVTVNDKLPVVASVWNGLPAMTNPLALLSVPVVIATESEPRIVPPPLVKLPPTLIVVDCPLIVPAFVMFDAAVSLVAPVEASDAPEPFVIVPAMTVSGPPASTWLLTLRRSR